MKKRAALISLCLLTLLTSSVFALEEPLTLLAAGDLRGELEPCGCSEEGQKGGLPRRLTYLESHYAKNKNILVDLGNNFPPPSDQGKLKIPLIQHLLKKFPPTALLVGPHELAMGVDLLDQALPYLLTNNKTRKTRKIFASKRVVKKNGKRVVIFGYLSPSLVYQKSQSLFALAPVNKSLLKEWAGALKNFDHRVLLFRGSDKELRTFVRWGHFDAIITGNPSPDEMVQIVVRKVNAVEVPQVPTKGQGVMRIVLKNSPRKINKKAPTQRPAKGKVDWLDNRFKDHLFAKKPFADYQAKVKALFFSRLQKMDGHKQTTPFLGAQGCKTCHLPMAEIWEKTTHAQAIKTLEKVGKQFDPECLVCHVVGLDKKGFLSQDLTPHFVGVQCENCHGPGKSHGANPENVRLIAPLAGKKGLPSENTCKLCHKGSHSPTFSFERYWPKIKHGRQSTN